MIIIGLGKTGQSCARYFKRKNIPAVMLDTRNLSAENKELLDNTKELILSPGVSPELFPNHHLIGDIELFAREAKAPIIAITGTNAKGTVTTLIGDMIKEAGYNVLVGGNIGTPALDLLEQPTPDFYVLEISSFQLETTENLHALVATVLNISPDHLDRHKTLENYIAAKQKIYKNCINAIYNLEDPNTFPQYPTKNKIGFGLDQKNNLPIEELKIKGLHNISNALAALAIGHAIGLPLDKMIEALKKFPGLEHRCEWVAQKNKIDFINDSKGTNIGATIAALKGLSKNKNIILIAGGVGKEQDFELLEIPVQKYVRKTILIGQDAPLIANALHAPYEMADTLKIAIEKAWAAAETGDIILLSPACASFDMFQDFEDRGRQFKRLVKEFLHT